MAKLNNSKGSALAIALSMLFLFAALGVGAINYGGAQRQFWTNQQTSSKAFWLADAGLQKAFASGCSTTGLSNVSLGQGQYTVTPQGGGTLISEGDIYANGKLIEKRRLQAVCTPANPLQNGLFAGGNINLSLGSFITGNVAANGTINGINWLGGNWTPNANITLPSVVVPPIGFSSTPKTVPAAVSKVITLSAGDYKGTNITLSGDSLNVTGVARVYLTGAGTPLVSFNDSGSSITIQNGASLTLYVDGQVIMSGTLSNLNAAAASSKFIIYSSYVSKNSSDYGVNITASGFLGFIYAPQANILISFSGTGGTGAIVGNNITTQNITVFLYDTSLSSYSDSTSFSPKLNNWVEIT